MGLDMYAHTINADVIGDAQVDIDVTVLLLNSVDFQHMTPAAHEKMSYKNRDTYDSSLKVALKKASSIHAYDTDFAYWRKFNHLHGWMEKLYYSKGGTAECFNCVNVRLMPEDLDVLKSLATAKAMTATQGFFFGSDEPFNDDDAEEVLDFVKKAQEAISHNKAVLYDSWW